ncbi:MAG: hypothetical protein LLG13_08215 [Bacteroidales bacterium]|nr:hypothetical protein [Bacteroidales bacterium]
MNRLKNLIISISVCIFFTGMATGQSFSDQYHVAVGLRAGESAGLSLKVNNQNSSGCEFLLGLWSNWISFTGLYEKNVQAFNINGMRWYYGAGGHIALETNTYYEQGRSYDRGSDFALGIDGIVGLEYKIPQIPFAVSLDLKPFLEMYRNGNLYFSADPGIGVKFTF